MDDNNNNSGEFNYSSSNDFKQVPKKEKKYGFGKRILVPFISGIVGAVVVLGVCLGVPSIKEKLFNDISDSSSSSSASTTRNF